MVVLESDEPYARDQSTDQAEGLESLRPLKRGEAGKGKTAKQDQRKKQILETETHRG